MSKRTVKIKTWEKMDEEYGTDSQNNIDCPGGFTDLMEESMPESRIIEIERDGDGYYWIAPNDDDWQITEEMIEFEVESAAVEMAIQFLEYCHEHPEQRFWQAMRNFTGNNFIFVSENRVEAEGLHDTFYMREKKKRETT